MGKKMTTEEFIRRAKEVHGDKYDYSKVEYLNSQTKVCIICPKHGEFWQKPNNHLNGKGCKKCANEENGNKLRITLKDFIKKAREVHGDKYDYSKVEYVDYSTKVCIICPKHGEFWQRPNDHLSGKGCKKCGKEIIANNTKGSLKDFIKKAREVHGDKYDYSKVEYKGIHTKVRIICPEHGEFWQEPNSHLRGAGCPNCAGNIQLTTEDFIRKAKEVHGDKYDYSKVEYVNSSTKVCIICPEHGEFWQNPANHLQGQSCPKCIGRNRTTEDFIKKAKEVHGDKYDYSKVVYKGAKTKVCIICPKHGEFWQTPSSHLSGRGCPICKKDNIGNALRGNTEDFIRKAKKVHGDKYDYSKAVYKDAKTKVCIICPEHGEFWQSPGIHLNGSGCIKCSGKTIFSTEDFIKKAVEIHGDKYDYSNVKYINNSTPVCIICPEHGEFWQIPSSHLLGYGCQKCGVEKSSEQKRMKIDEFIDKANEIHKDKYDYSKVEYVNSHTKVCIICPEHGEFWQEPFNHLKGVGCPCCNRGLTKQYKFNLLQEFKNEYEFRAFLENNDRNILYVIISVLEPKYDPLKDDVKKALTSKDISPIKILEDKYSSDYNDDIDDDTSVETPVVATTPVVDLDDDDAIDAVLPLNKEIEEPQSKPTIDDIIKNTEKEIKVISKIEHLLTPEVRKYIMDKFLNDKRRAWMLKRENSVK